MRIALVTGGLQAMLGGEAPALAERADAPLVDAFRVRGVEVARPSWRDPEVDWAAFDLALVRTTWDYPCDRDAFVTWAAAVGQDTALWNPADVLRWNTHKSYLLELEDHGAPIVPSAWLGQGDAVDLGDLLAHRGWADVVIKPAVGASGTGVRRVRRDAPASAADVAAAVAPAAVSADAADAVVADAPDPASVLARGNVAVALDLDAGQGHLDALLAVGDVVVQQFMPAATGRGERSVVVIDGQATHVVRAAPVDAAGGRVDRSPTGAVRERLDRETAQLATWVVDATGADLLYARVDLLEDELGAPQVLELECTEPFLALEAVPDATNRLAAAAVRLATG